MQRGIGRPPDPTSACKQRVCCAAHERFTIRVWQTDNHRRRRQRRARRSKGDSDVGKGKTGRDLLRLERGRRRTRQDQIPPGEKIPGDIADLKRSAPNEESLFLLPDRPCRSASASWSSIQPF